MQTGPRKRSTSRPERSRKTRRAAWALLVGSACAAGADSAFAQPAGPAVSGSGEAKATAPPIGEPVIRLASRNEQIKVVERFSKVLTLPDRIARVDGFDQEVIDVAALDSRSIRVHAKAPGVTTMTLVDEQDRPYTVDVLVVGDVRHLQELLGRLFPNSAIEVVEVRESVVLRGWVTEPHQITEIVEIAEQFYPRVLNQMQVGCVQQVMLKVKVMEVQRSKLRQMGFNFIYQDGNGFLSSTPGGLVPITQIASDGAIDLMVDGNSLANPTAIFGVVNENFAFTGFIEALKREQLLKILAEPNLTTMNGRPANLLSGGEIPVPVAQGLGTLSLEYRKYGTRLEAVPLVLSNSRVRLEVFAEVSALDYANASNINGALTPGLLTRNANTQVELNFGESLVIGGLMQTTKAGSTSKVPGLGDMPYIGAAFRRVRYEDTETELVIMVTPELVAPMPPGQVPPGGPGMFTDDPTAKELFGYGMLEVPSYGDRCQGQCQPPEPTYDPHHPAGMEHIAPPGMMMPGPGMPPAGYPTPVGPPSPAPTMMPTETVIPSGPAPAVSPEFPPPAPAPSTSSLRTPQRTASSAAKATRSGVTPAGHERPAVRRPGLIEPGRPVGGR